MSSSPLGTERHTAGCREPQPYPIALPGVQPAAVWTEVLVATVALLQAGVRSQSKARAGVSSAEISASYPSAGLTCNWKGRLSPESVVILEMSLAQPLPLLDLSVLTCGMRAFKGKR